MKVAKSTERIAVRELYCILSSRLFNEIKLCEKGMVWFWVKSEMKWKLIRFSGRMDEENDEDEGEGDQIEAVEGQWGNEVKNYEIKSNKKS